MDAETAQAVIRNEWLKWLGGEYREQAIAIADLIEYQAAEITRLKAERWVTMEFYDDPEKLPDCGGPVCEWKPGDVDAAIDRANRLLKRYEK